MSAESREISRTLPDQIQGPPSPLYNGYWGSFPVVPGALSNLNSVVTFVPDSAPLMSSMLSARPPVVRYPRVKTIFRMMDLVNNRSCKKLILDLSTSVRPIKSWEVGRWRWIPSPPSTEIKERIELYLHSLCGLSWPVLRCSLLYNRPCFITS
jgi:hypothetical protein